MADQINIIDNQLIESFINITNKGAGVTGLSPTFSLQRSSDALWWNGSAWQVSKANLAMTEYDATNKPGYYVYFWTANTALSAENYRAEIINTGTYPVTDTTLYAYTDALENALTRADFIDLANREVTARDVDGNPTTVLIGTSTNQETISVTYTGITISGTTRVNQETVL